MLVEQVDYGLLARLTDVQKLAPPHARGKASPDSGLIDPEGVAPVAERADDVALVPMAGEDTAPGDAPDGFAARGEQPRAPRVAVDQLAGNENDGGAQRPDAGRRCSTSAAIASR